jgi:hypothetical protein
MYRTLLPDGAKPRSPIADWGGDPRALVVGVEEERFVLNADGSAPSLEQVLQIFETLAKEGFQRRQVDERGRPFSLGKEYSEGYLSLKMDSFTHIVEIALPPIFSPERIKQILEDTWTSVVQASDRLGLVIIQDNSYLPNPSGAQFMPNFTRAQWMLDREKPKARGLSNYDPELFLGTMTSTQVHLNAEKDIYPQLPKLYEFEYLISILFRNQSMQDPAFDNRNMTWLSVFPPSYCAAGIPDPIPFERRQYEALIEKTQDFRKDYGFIVPRKTGSIEFRTADSQPSSDSTLELIAFRIGTLIASRKFKLHIEPDQIRRSLASTYQFGTFDRKLIWIHANEIYSIYAEIPVEWKPYFKSALTRFRSYLENDQEQSLRYHLG